MADETEDLLTSLLSETTADAPEATVEAPKPRRTRKAKAADGITDVEEEIEDEPAKPEVPVTTIEAAPVWTPPADEPEEAPAKKPAQVDHSKREEGDYSHLTADQLSRLRAEQAAGRGRY